jgi:uncharacterized membrane protein YhaH (DUF805 family)
LKELEDEIDQ